MSDAQLLDAALRSIGAALLHSLWQGALLGGGHRPRVASARRRPAVDPLSGRLRRAGADGGRVDGHRLADRGPARPRGPAAARAGAAAPALGPAGPFDFSPAIRPISRADLEAGAPSWRYRLESWSMALVPVWLLGVCGLSLRLALAWLWVERVRRARSCRWPRP